MLILPLEKLLSPISYPTLSQDRYQSRSTSRFSRKEPINSVSPIRPRAKENTPQKVCFTSRQLEEPKSFEKKQKRRKRILLHAKMIITHEDLNTIRFETKHETAKRTKDTWTDPTKVLIYDHNPLNRKRAARRICDLIVKQVRSSQKNVQFLDYFTDTESSQEHSQERSEDETDLAKFKLPSLKNKLGKYKTLDEKLSMISELNKEHFISKSAKAVNFQHIPPALPDHTEAVSQLSSEQSSRDSSYIYRLASEKVTRDLHDLLRPPFASNQASETLTYMNDFLKSKISNLIPQLSSIKKSTSPILYNDLLLLLEAKKSKSSDEIQDRFSFSNLKVSVPSCNMDSRSLLFMISCYSAFSSLMYFNIRDNPHIGDTAISTLTLVLAHFCPLLIHYDISSTGATRKTAVAMQILLSKRKCKIKRLAIGNNRLGDEGLSDLAIGCAKSSTLKSLDIQFLSLDLQGPSAISKIIRFCKSLRYINMSGNSISGDSFKQISRSIIINRELKCIGMNGCYLDDLDMKELDHSLQGNPYLKSVDLCKNSISKKGLGYIYEGLLKSSRLSHLGLEENSLSMETLEKFKDLFPAYKKIEIMRDQDFKTTQYYKEAIGKMLKYFN